MYSFRRCPYAMRARYVLATLKVSVELREVVLKKKPAALLQLGGRTTVPQLIDGLERYPESLDIIFWALKQAKDQALVKSLSPEEPIVQVKIRTWLNYNDQRFKYWLDRYKYADRYPECSESYYREKGAIFLKRLDARLSSRKYLMGDHQTIADIGIFPFIRQFASVNSDWFQQSEFTHLKRWLESYLQSECFEKVMFKYPVWDEAQEITHFP